MSSKVVPTLAQGNKGRTLTTLRPLLLMSPAAATATAELDCVTAPDNMPNACGARGRLNAWAICARSSPPASSCTWLPTSLTPTNSSPNAAQISRNSVT